MNRQRIATVLFAAVMVTSMMAVPGAVAAQESPDPPASYHGSVTVDGEQAPAGLVVEAEVNGDVVDSLTVKEAGEYGGSGVFEDKLLVGSNTSIDSGSEVQFFIDGNDIERTEAESTNPSPVEFEAGDVQRVDLTFENVPEADDGNNADNGGSPPTDGGGAPGGGGSGDAPSGDGSGGAPGGSGGSGSGGSGGADTPDAPGDAPTDEPSVGDVVRVPEGATAVASEAATVQASADGASSSVAFAGETGVEGIEFGGAVGGDVGVVELDGAPESTGRAPGAGVSVVEITVPDDARNTPATIRTRISADRLEAAGADAEDLRLSRHSAGEWQALETSVVDRDGGDVVLAAETPGFSVFAVSAVSEPEAAITVDSDAVETGESVTLSGVRSSDRYGEIVAYDWDVDGETAAGSVTETTFSEPGEYEVELTVTNDAGETDSTTATVAVESAGTAAAAPVEEPGLFSLTTLGAVVGALALALLVVAAARRADR